MTAEQIKRLVDVLDAARSGSVDVVALATAHGTTPQTVRRDLRELQQAGVIEPRKAAA